MGVKNSPFCDPTNRFRDKCMQNFSQHRIFNEIFFRSEHSRPHGDPLWGSKTIHFAIRITVSEINACKISASIEYLTKFFFRSELSRLHGDPLWGSKTVRFAIRLTVSEINACKISANIEYLTKFFFVRSPPGYTGTPFGGQKQSVLRSDSPFPR